MNQTMKTFGFPASLIREYRNWVVLLRPKQPTLGGMPGWWTRWCSRTTGEGMTARGRLSSGGPRGDGVVGY